MKRLNAEKRYRDIGNKKINPDMTLDTFKRVIEWSPFEWESWFRKSIINPFGANGSNSKKKNDRAILIASSSL